MAAKLCKRGGGGCGVQSLPKDTILEVLVRLPAKAVCRCRCVCKGWRALISSPAFVAALRSHATSPLIVAVFGSAPEHELQLLDKGGNVLMVFNIRGCTALLAPTRLDLIFIDRVQLGAMIIHPVSGRDFTVVGTNDPLPPPWWAPTSTLTAVSSDYSFGRAAASGDYKVLRLVTSLRWDVRSKWCEVATIMDGGEEPTWRQRPLGPFLDTSCLISCEHKATVNGVLYFMLHNSYSESHGRKCIAAFDLESEEWKPEKIKGPLLRRKNNDDKWRITLTELKGTLCMVDNVQYLSDLVGHYANIWLLKDPNRSVWVKEYRIQMLERLLLFTKPLDVLIDGTLLLLNEFRKAGNPRNCHRYILQLYNSSTKAFTDFMEMAEGFNGKMAFYTGSLQS